MHKDTIPQSGAVVKQPSVTERWEWHKRTAQLVSLALIDAGYIKRGERMAVCSDVVTYRYCRACDTWHVDRANLCRDRLCPICNWRLSLQRYATMQRVVAPLVSQGLSWALVTLTVQNCIPACLRQTVDAIMGCWHRALARCDMRASVGWARGMELTYNADEGTLHPHLHILVCWPPESDRSRGLIKAWLELCTRAGLKVDVKAQHSAALDAPDGNDLTRDILETYKYSIKGSDVVRMPVGTLRDVAAQWGGRRLMALGGILKSAAAEIKLNDLDEDTPLSVCRSCGSVELDRYLARWSMGEQVYKLIELRRSAPLALADIDTDAAGPSPAVAGDAPSERADMPVLLQTINGPVLMYPGGQYQVLTPAP